MVVVGYPVQRHYLQHRYADPTFTTPGLNAAFKWARRHQRRPHRHHQHPPVPPLRQRPLQPRRLHRRERPHGGFEAPTTCRTWRHLLNAGNYDYVVASRDRIEPGKPPTHATARWTEAPGATVVLRKPPTVVFKLRTPLDPSACRR